MLASLKKKHVRFTMDVNLSSEAEKSVFRDQLIPRGSPAISNHELLLFQFSLVDMTA